MDKRDFKNLLSEAFGKYDKKSKKFLKDIIEKNNKKLIREFNRFVDISIIPQFEDIRKEMNDASHCRDQMLRTLEKHEDRFDHMGRRQDKMLKVLEKHGNQLERIEAKF